LAIYHLIFDTVEASVHLSLEVYAFIALTASSSTLHGLIEMVKADNNQRQEDMDETGGLSSKTEC
jgi:hypothetical protein